MTEREVDRLRVGVDHHPEHRRELRKPAARAGLVQPHAARVAEHQVLQHGQRGDQRRVLVDGADPELQCDARRGDLRLDALDRDRPGVRPVQSGEDPDQRRLSGAVLPEQAVHLAAAERQVDPVIREHTREPLRDPGELDDRRVGRCAHPGRLSVLQERAARGGKKTTAGGVRDRTDYLISLFTSPALLAAGILIAPLRIFARAAVISAQVFAGMYFVFSSEMPPFFRFRS